MKRNKPLSIFCIVIVVSLTFTQFLPGLVEAKPVNKIGIVRNSGQASDNEPEIFYNNTVSTNTNVDIASIAKKPSNNQTSIDFDYNETESVLPESFSNEMLLLGGGSTEVTPYVRTTYDQGFENDFSEQVEVDYAHPNYFSRETSSTYIKEGDYSLKATPDSNGKNYDGVQFNLTFSDGIIEGWFYPKSSYSLIPALWLRTTTLNTTSNPSFREGYMLRIYMNTAYIQRRDITNGWTTLATYNLGEYITSKWWHMKFETNGTQLSGWVTKNEAFTTTPQLSYNTENDNIKFNYGKPGLTVRTNMPSSIYPTYVDDVKIIFNEGYYESFEPNSTGIAPDLPNSFDYAHSNYYSVTNERSSDCDNGQYSLKATPNSSGKNYDGIQFNQSIEDGSIEAWFYPKRSSYLIPALWLRTSNLNPTTNPSFTEGYMLRLYVNTAYIQRRDTTNGWTTLATYSLGENIMNTWWHMKFDAYGSYLNAWVTKYDTFNEEPLFAYDTTSDSIKFEEGKPGITMRTQMSSSNYPTYVDSIRVKSAQTLTNAEEIFSIQQLAYCPEHELCWNLLTDEGVEGLSTFLLNYKMDAVRLYLRGRFLEQIDSNSYYLTDIQTLQFDIWSHTENSWDYIYFTNVNTNGELDPNIGFDIKLFDLIDILVSTQGMDPSEAEFNFARNLAMIGGGLIALGGILLGLKIAVTATVVQVLGLVSLALGFILLIVAIIFTIIAYVIYQTS